MVNTDIQVRNVSQTDRQRLANLINFEEYVHRHLDWKPPLDWIGSSPYIVAERGDELVAALACPPELPEVAWLRLFAVKARVLPDEAWQLLWAEVRDNWLEWVTCLCTGITGLVCQIAGASGFCACTGCSCSGVGIPIFWSEGTQQAGWYTSNVCGGSAKG
jgi:hypothetical protein